MRSSLLVIVALVISVPAAAQRNCRKGIPCGNSCIAASKTCRIGTSQRQPERAADQRPQPASSVTEPSDLNGTALSLITPTSPAQEMTVRRIRFVGNASGNIYYAAGCAPARSIPDELRVYFHSERAARELKYVRSTTPEC